MIRCILLGAVIALASACSSVPVRIDSRALGDQVSLSSDRYIIVAVDNVPATYVAHAGSTPRGYDAVADYGATARALETLHAVEREYRLREVNAWPIGPLQIHCAVLEIPSGADRAQLLAALSKDRRVKLTQPLQTFATRTEDYNDPYVGLQRGFQQMDVADAQAWSRGEGVKVAMIAAVANNREGIVGVAPNARLFIFKACWQAQSDADAARCNSFTLARALTAAFDAHAQVINLSLAGPDDPLLGDLIREGQHRGVLFVGAAPHTAGVETGLMHQAGVIEVASAESHSAIDSVLYAPGREILTLLPGGHYDFASGASIATAQVSGVVALMLAKSPGLSAASAYRLMRDTSSSLQTADGVKGVDACAAVVTLRGQGTCHASEGKSSVASPAGNRIALH